MRRRVLARTMLGWRFVAWVSKRSRVRPLNWILMGGTRSSGHLHGSVRGRHLTPKRSDSRPLRGQPQVASMDPHWDGKTCAACDDPAADGEWWVPSSGRLMYLTVHCGLEQGDADGPKARLCTACARDLETLISEQVTGVRTPTQSEPLDNDLTAFLDRVDVEEFRDAGVN